MHQFDIALTSYKRPKLLAEAIRSCLNQGQLLRQVIVVDDASQDDTAEVVRALGDPRILFHQRAVNGGIAVARKDGFALSEADWTVKLDSDQELLPGALDRLDALSKRAGQAIDILGGRFRWDTGMLSPKVVPPGVVDYCGRIRYASRPESIGKDYVYAISRRLRETVRYEALRSFVPDTLFQLDLAKAGNAVFTGEVLGLEKSCTEHSWTRGSAAARWTRRVQDAADGILAVERALARHGDAMRQWGRPLLSQLLANGSFYSALMGRRAQARRWGSSAVALHPSGLSCSAFLASVAPKTLLAQAYQLRG